MNFNDYQSKAVKFALPESRSFVYLFTGLGAEVGEVLGKYAKYIRDDTPYRDLEESLKKELGDVLWFVSMIATQLGVDLADVAGDNLAKLSGRMNRGTIGGSGDTR
jgi:NTP pyrophosphatase (non-canonical NTP hydrolase)